MRGLLFLLSLWVALPLQAEEVVLGLSSDEVPITATFTGSEILVFGAVKRDRPVPDGPPLEVIVTVAGPSEPVEVRRKSRRFGIWVNTSSVRIGSAPSFFAVAASGQLSEVLSETEDLRHQISLPRSLRTVGASEDDPDAAAFTEALIRIRREEGTYQVLDSSVALEEQTLFRAAVFLPPRLTEGDYTTRIFLTRNRDVLDIYETVIDVRRVGLERWLYNLSQQKPLVYGLMALVIASVCGWSASAAARLLRG